MFHFESLLIVLSIVYYNRRDGKSIESMFESNGIWITGGPLGIVNENKIQEVIKKLPPISKDGIQKEGHLLSHRLR